MRPSSVMDVQFVFIDCRECCFRAFKRMLSYFQEKADKG